MSEDWDAMAAEVTEAITDLGVMVTVTRSNGAQQTPWDAVSDTKLLETVMVIDTGIQLVRVAGSSERAERRVIMAGADWQTPTIGDKVTIRDAEHEVLAVYPTAPGGTDVAFRVELST